MRYLKLWENWSNLNESSLSSNQLTDEHYYCIDCGTHEMLDNYFGKAFMVLDDIWDGITNEDEKYKLLCWDCVEKRLGRKLTPEDFNDSFLNKMNTRLQELKKAS